MKLRSIFPANQLDKGTPLIISSKPSKAGSDRTLVFGDLGSIENSWIAKEFFKAYFIDSGISPAVRGF